MQIAKTIKSTNKILQGMLYTQRSEITLLTDNSGSYFIKSAGNLTRMSRESAQDTFQKDFDEFWKYLELNKLYEQFPELYTKEEALKIQKNYATTPKKKVTNNDTKVNDYYENFVSCSI